MMPSQSVAADYALKTGNDLMEFIQNFDKTMNGPLYTGDDLVQVNMKANIYMGYVLGVSNSTAFLYKLPNDMTVGQLCAIVSKYSTNHPEKWSSPAFSLVEEALQEAFPLKK